MKIDVSRSRYHEADDAEKEFEKDELKKLRMVLRRLRWLEQKIRLAGGLQEGSADSGLIFDSLEVEGLAWVLNEIGYLSTRER